MNTSVRLPMMPMRGIVIFPYMVVHLDAGRERSVAAIEKAMAGDRRIFLCAQKNGEVNDPSREDLYDVGTVAQVRQMVKLPDGACRVLVEGEHRAEILDTLALEHFDTAVVVIREDEIDNSMEMEALTRGVVHRFEEWVKASKQMPQDMMVAVAMTEHYGRLADLMAGHMNLSDEVKQTLLELFNVRARMERLLAILMREMKLLALERRIGSRVKNQVEKIQKEYYLREKIKAIHTELGDNDGRQEFLAECQEKLKQGNYPEDVRKAVEKELKRLAAVGDNSAEGGVIRTYVDCLLAMPWRTTTKEKVQLKQAARILDHDHYGLEKVKERILDYLAVYSLIEQKRTASKDTDGPKEDATHGTKAPILCLVGPPGVGKTSLAASVARALGRMFTRASLGGIRDEAEIRGHRRTYIGAMPGRIMSGIKRAGTKNPVFLLDEVDKLGSDYHGDPSAALLEVLDPAQNRTFTDHYVDLPFDLSEVFWIVTANDLGSIPRALRDRMEVLTLSSYTEQEKLEIAKQYLLPRQREENGLESKDLQLGAPVLQRIITEYTRESGVRELERVLGKLCRKVARRIVDDGEMTTKVTARTLETFLERPKYPHAKPVRKAEIGVATGMAWTQVGGDLLPTEVNVFPGKGKLILTGKLGDVMKESAAAALSYIRSRAAKFDLAEDFHEKLDIHIHLPEGAVPKDGPSAGITMATAMLSALTQKKVRADVAMTGEITIRGRVLAIGGLKEKVLAAYREGIRFILLPKENVRDIEDIPKSVQEKLTFVPVESMDEVLRHVWEEG